MQAMTPTPVLEILMKSLTNSSWRVREEIINVVIVSMSIFPRQQFDFQQLVGDLAPALQDKKSRVKFVAIEAFAVIQNLNGEAALMSHLQSSNVSSATMDQLRRRFSAAQELPTVGGDGLVEHRSNLGSAHSTQSSGGDAPTGEGGGYGNRHMQSLRSRTGSAGTASPKLPWNADRPTSKSGRGGGSREESGYTPSPSGSATRRRRPPASSSNDTANAPASREGSYANMYKAKMAGRSTASPTTPLKRNENSNDGGGGSGGGGGGYAAIARQRTGTNVARTERGSGRGSKSTSPTDVGSPFPTSAKIARPSSLRRSSASSVTDSSGNNGNNGSNGANAYNSTYNNSTNNSRVPGSPGPSRRDRSGAPPTGRAGRSTSTSSDPGEDTQPKPSKARHGSTDSAGSVKKTGIPTPWGARESSGVAAQEDSSNRQHPPSTPQRPVTRQRSAESPFRAGTPKLNRMSSRSRVSSATSMHDALVGSNVDVSGAGADTGPRIQRIDIDAMSAAAGGGAANSAIPAPREQRNPEARGEPPPPSTSRENADNFEPPSIPRLERSGPIEMEGPDSDISIDSDSADSEEDGGGGYNGGGVNETSSKENALSSSIPAVVTAVDGRGGEAVEFKDEDDRPTTPGDDSSIGDVASDDVFTDPEDEIVASPTPAPTKRNAPAPVPAPAPAPASAASVPKSALPASGARSGIPAPGTKAKKGIGGNSTSNSGGGKPPKAPSPKSPSVERKKKVSAKSRNPASSPATPRRPPARSTGPKAAAATSRSGGGNATRSKSPKPARKSPAPLRKKASPEPAKLKSPEPAKKTKPKSPKPARKTAARKAAPPKKAPEPEPEPEQEKAPVPELTDFERELMEQASAGKTSNFSTSRDDFSSGSAASADSGAAAAGASFESGGKPRPPKGPRGGTRPSRKTPGSSLKQSTSAASLSAVRDDDGHAAGASDNESQSESPTRKSPVPSAGTPSRNRGSHKRPPRPENKVQAAFGKPPGTSGSSSRAGSGNSRGTTSQSLRSTSNPADAFMLPRAEIKPYTKPEGSALKASFAAMQRGHAQETWLDACEGLNIVRQLLVHNEDLVVASFHVIVEAVLGEMHNLRSQVSRIAILAFGDFFEVLGKAVNDELDLMVAGIFKKVAASAGDAFVRADMDVTIGKMVDNVNHKKVLSAILPGAQHRSQPARQCCVETMIEVIEAEGEKILAFKDAERMLVSLARLADDKDPYIRYVSRRGFSILMNAADFEKKMRKALPEKQYANMKTILEKLRSKGLGNPVANPRDKHSAMSASLTKGSRSATGTSQWSSASAGSPKKPRSSSAGDTSSPSTPKVENRRAASGPSTPGRSKKGTLGRSNSSRSAKSGKSNWGPTLSTSALEELEGYIDKLGNKDWKTRDDGVIAAEELAIREGVKMQSAMNKLFDAFTPRLADSNSKVNLHALEAFRRFLPAIKDAFGPHHAVVVQVVNKLSGNLASKSKGIVQTTADSFKDLTIHLEPTLLIQPFASAAGYGTPKVKEGMMDHICVLVGPVCDSNTKLVKKHLMPLVAQLLGEKKSKTECKKLCYALNSKMGSSALLDAASSFPPDKKKLLEAQISAF